MSTPSASSISVASTSRTPPFSVSRPSPRATRASGPSPWCRGRAAGRAAVAQLREQEAAAVAEVGVVDPELVAVIAQRQRLGQIVRAAARSGRNGAIHSASVSVVEPDRSAAARSLRKRRIVCGKLGRLDGVVEIPAELENRALGAVASLRPWSLLSQEAAAGEQDHDECDKLMRFSPSCGPSALSFPGAHGKAPWPDHDDLAVNDKTFAYLPARRRGAFQLSVKLPYTR